MSTKSSETRGDFVVRRHPTSAALLYIGMTQEVARLFVSSAGAPYVWWSAQDTSWLISEPAIHNAMRHAIKVGLRVTDLRSDDGGAAFGEWCGQCDERTRHLPGIGGAVVRCPRCHPLADQAVSTLPLDEAPEVEVYREGLAKVREELLKIRKREPPVDPAVPF